MACRSAGWIQWGHGLAGLVLCATAMADGPFPHREEDDSVSAIAVAGHGFELLAGSSRGAVRSIELPVSMLATTPDQLINFGTIPEESSAVRTLLIENIGNIDLNVVEITLQGADADRFSIDEPCVGNPLPPQDSCPVDVEFTPGKSGEFNAALAIESDTLPAETRIVNLRGSAADILFADGFESLQ